MADATAELDAPGRIPPPQRLPGPIRRILAGLDRRLRAASVLAGLGTLGLVAAVVAAVGMGLDLAWSLPTAVRWGVWTVWLAAVVGLVARLVVRGAARRPRVALAALAERVAPELGERLTGAVGLIDVAGSRLSHGSPALIAALAADASARVEAVDPARAVPLGRAWTRFALGILVVAVVAAPAVARPDPFGRLARRFLMPWAAIDRVGRFTVSVAPGDAVAALGDDLTVTATVAPRFGVGGVPTTAWLEWTERTGGRARRLAMGPVAEASGPTRTRAKSFRLVLPRLADSLEYRVVAGTGGEAESRRHRIRAVAPPTVATLTVRVEPPSYTGFPARPARDPARVEAWEDSRVTLTVTPSRPVGSVDVDWPRSTKRTQPAEGTEPEPNWIAAVLGPEGATATVSLPAEVSGSFAIRLRDRDGIVSRAEPPRRLVVRPDGPPVVSLRGMEGLDEARADDTLRFEVEARDDVAVASAELHYTLERGGSLAGSKAETGQVALKLEGLGTATAGGPAVLGLKTLGLAPGDAVSYRVRVVDNRPAPRGPNEAWSAPTRLGIVASAAPLWARRSQADRAAIQAKLEALSKTAAENRHETELLRYAADAAARGNGKWDRERAEALASREASARDVADRLQVLARDLEDDPAFAPLSRPARQVAEVEAEAARAALDQARQDLDAPRRLADLRLADTRLGAVSTRLDELRRQLDQLGRRDAARQRLQALADRQEEVADRAEAADPHAPLDRARLDQLDAEQNGVRKDLDALLREAPELKADLLAARAAEAETLAKRARALAARQREEARRGADLTPKAAVLKALADEQRALEDEARRLALDVDQPLAEIGRGRLNTEPIRQAAAPIERADLPLGRQRLVEAEHELRRLARDLDDAPKDLKALARRLAQTQDRVVRDLAEALGDARGKPEVPADERAAVAARLAPLVARQKVVTDLAGALLETREARDEKAQPRFPLETARAALAAATRGGEALGKPDAPREVERTVAAARDALNRLANELPDVWRRDEPARRVVNQSRQALHDALREVERHLRETEPTLARDPARAASDLANRLATAADRARAAADQLDAPDVRFPDRVAPQRDRAEGRARALAEAVARVKAQAIAPASAPFDADRARTLRDGLDAAARDARAGFDRLDQKLNGQVPADDLAEELAAEQHALALHPGAPGGPQDDLAGDQRRLASALRGLRDQVPDAPLELEEAVRRAEHAARAAARPEDPKAKADPAAAAEAEAVGRTAEAVEALARRLNDRQSPRGRVEALARTERGLNEPDAVAEAASDPAGAERRQRAVAAELDRLASAEGAEASSNASASAEAAVRDARALAGRAAKPPQPGAVAAEAPPTPADLARARSRAADALDALAARLPDARPSATKPPAVAKPSVPRDPEGALTPEHAVRAGELARQERRLRERLQAVLADRVDPQRDLRRDSAALGRELAELRDRVRDVSPRAAGPANESAALLGEHAPRSMDAAADQLAQGQPAPARDAQRRAAELAERGAQSVDDLAAALRADIPPDAAQAQANPDPDSKHRIEPAANPLAAAREAMDAAARNLQQARDAASSAPPTGPNDPLQSARQAMRGAADGLQAAAEARARGQGQGRGEGQARTRGKGTPSGDLAEGDTPDPRGGKAGAAAAAELREVQELVRQKSGRAWGELPGHLRTEILQMSQGRYRDDYARLIQLYFREIAAGAEGSGPDPGPGPGPDSAKEARP